MTNGRVDFVVHLSNDWRSYSRGTEGYLFGDVPFLKALASLPGVRVLCVNQPVTPVETTLRKPAKAAHWLRNSTVEKLGNGLYLLTPYAFVHEMVAAALPSLGALNSRLLKPQILGALEGLGFDAARRVSMIFHPLQRHLFGLAGETHTVYKCWDLYRAREFSPKIRAAVLENEEALVAEAGSIVTPCINIFKEFKEKKERTFFIPAGVDPVDFAPESGSSYGAPEDLERFPRPWIGFTGRITKRVDLGLVRAVAQRRPEWSFILLGTVSESDPKLLEEHRLCSLLPNVHFPGFRDFSKLPAYIRSFDACILPHADIPAMRYSHPYKTLQYLAAGKPVVSTGFPDIRYYESVVRIADDAEGFASALSEALRLDSDAARKKATGFARANSWVKRAEESLAAISGDRPVPR